MAAQSHLKLGEVSSESGTNRLLNDSSVRHARIVPMRLKKKSNFQSSPGHDGITNDRCKKKWWKVKKKITQD